MRPLVTAFNGVYMKKKYNAIIIFLSITIFIFIYLTYSYYSKHNESTIVLTKMIEEMETNKNIKLEYNTDIELTYNILNVNFGSNKRSIDVIFDKYPQICEGKKDEGLLCKVNFVNNNKNDKLSFFYDTNNALKVLHYSQEFDLNDKEYFEDKCGKIFYFLMTNFDIPIRKSKDTDDIIWLKDNGELASFNYKEENKKLLLEFFIFKFDI
jgi:hypothetical protein